MLQFILRNHFVLCLVLIFSNLSAQKTNKVNQIETTINPYFSNQNKISRLNKSVVKQQLDSVVDEEFHYLKKNWTGKYKHEFKYDMNGNNTEYIDLKCTDTINTWVNEGKRMFNFDKSNNCIAINYFEWYNKDKAWFCYHKLEYSFNIFNQKSSHAYYISNYPEHNNFNIYNLGSYLYNKQNQLLTQHDSCWDPGFNDIDYSQKYDYFYDSFGNNILFTTSSVNSFDKKWRAIYKREKTYDSKGNNTSIANFNHDDKGNWAVMDLTEYYYDNKSRKILSTYSEYDWEVKKEVVMLNKTETTYDSLGNTLSEIIYYNDANKWVLGEKIIYSYNYNYLTTDLVSSYNNSYPVFHKNMLIGHTSQYYLNNQWNDYKRSHYYYSTIDFTSVKENQEKTYNIYPNPTNGAIQINSLPRNAVIEVYDITGKQMDLRKLATNSTLDLSELPNGIYYIIIQNESGKTTRNKVLLAK